MCFVRQFRLWQGMHHTFVVSAACSMVASHVDACLARGTQSWFLNYILMRVAYLWRDPPRGTVCPTRVVLLDGKRKRRVNFTRDGHSLELSWTDVDADLQHSPRTLFLFDPAEASSRDGHVQYPRYIMDGLVVMASPPNSAHFPSWKAWTLQTPGLLVLFMPELTLDEATPHIPVPTADDASAFGTPAQRFEVVGGNLRLLCNPTLTLRALRKEVQEMLDTLELEKLVAVAKAAAVASEAFFALSASTSSMLLKVRCNIGQVRVLCAACGAHAASGGLSLSR